jgi:hypothetical protein
MKTAVSMGISLLPVACSLLMQAQQVRQDAIAIAQNVTSSLERPQLLQRLRCYQD